MNGPYGSVQIPTQEAPVPATARTTRTRWIDEGLAVLAEGGPDAVRVEVVAARLGVTKGGFYGAFANRPAYLAELLDEWERRCTTGIIDQAERSDDPAERIRRAGMLIADNDLLRIDLAVRAWARHDPGVAGRLRRVDTGRMDFLRACFAALVADPDEVEARAFLAFSLTIGRHFIVADDTTADAVRLAGEHLLRPNRTDRADPGADSAARGRKKWSSDGSRS